MYQTGQLAAPEDKTFGSFSEFYLDSAYADFPQEHRSLGLMGMTIVRASQPPIDLIDAAVPEHVFQMPMMPGRHARIEIGGETVTNLDFKAGSICLAPPSETARYDISDPHLLLSLAIPAAAMSELFEAAGARLDALDHYVGRLEQNAPASALLQRLWALANPEAVGACHLAAQGVALEALGVLAGLGDDEHRRTAGPEDRRVSRAIEYIEDNLAEPLAVDGIAAAAFVSPSALARLFKSGRGESLWSYVGRRRLERAREMVLGSREPLAQIAFACGFSSHSHLTRAFTRRYGVPPGIARRTGL